MIAAALPRTATAYLDVSDNIGQRQCQGLRCWCRFDGRGWLPRTAKGRGMIVDKTAVALSTAKGRGVFVHVNETAVAAALEQHLVLVLAWPWR